MAIAIGLVASGAGLTGAVAFAAATTAAGVVFAGVAGIAAQIASFGRTAISIAVGALAAAYLLRAWGDASSYHWATWLSPLGGRRRSRVHQRPLVDAGAVARGGRCAGVGGGGACRPARFRARTDRRASRPGRRPRLAGGDVRSRLAPAPGRLVGWVLGLAVYGALIGSVARSIASVISHSAIGKRSSGRARLRRPLSWRRSSV